MIRAGFAKVKITPKPGTLMGGHVGIKRVDGVHDDLYARTMVLQSGNESISITSVDILFVDTDIVNYVRKKTASATQLKPENIFVCATHTHSGPLTTNLFGQPEENKYTSELRQLICESISMAMDNMSRVSLGFGRGAVKGVSFNSRFIMRDGTVQTHPVVGSSEIVGPEGPVDESVQVLVVRREDGDIVGCLVNYANHPQNLRREDSYVSADYPGRLEQHINSCGKNSSVVLFLNGACGNICPVNACTSACNSVGIEHAIFMGRKIGDVVLDLLGDMDFCSNISIKSVSRKINIPLREITRRQIEEAKEYLKRTEDCKEPPKLSNYGIEPTTDDVLSLQDFLQTPYWKRVEAQEVLMLSQEKARCGLEVCELSVVEIGRSAIVMLPFELFVEYGLQIKSHSPYFGTIIAELSNGYSGYIPTTTAFSRAGSYETITLTSSKLVPEAGDMVVKEILAIMAEIRSSGRGIPGIHSEN
jgi:neutral ceramidase